MVEKECFGLPNSVVERIKAVFQSYPQIDRVLIYGSRALGNYKLGSDIDLCIECDEFSIKDLFEIENQLDDLMLPWKIDLSLRHLIDNASLLNHIIEKGKEF